MKIARVVFELDFGGVEKVTELILKGFRSIPTMSIQTISLGKGGRISEKLTGEGYLVFVLNQKAKIPDFFLIYQLAKLFRKEGFDVVHTVGAEANFHGLLAAAIAGVPLRIGEEIGFPKHHFLYRWIFSFTYRLAHRVICVSEAVRRQLFQIGELPLQRSQVVYNPIELPEVKQKLVQEGEAIEFITISRLTEIKNISSVIQALAAIVHETDFRPHLRIVGDGEERKSLKKLVQELQVDRYVTFHGYQAEVFDLLTEADVFVLPSFTEGSSLALAEAMHAGLPSVVTRVGGASEILGDSGSGVLIDPTSLDELKKAMLFFKDLDLSVRQEMGMKAKKQAARFSVDHYCQELFKLYSDELSLENRS
ncbi:glycosyltransferase [Algoriphagus aestuariicola]|uniref:Glycosyltransferase n=1 Tax=Algoriphagus aestuariicola TaxID=1852016 RepID=A0ABS3BLK3_9BACT|nr:glycosyltransferase [Algoriphagus aestuariicola]MBN7800188.1 glycosyltransferase [Algoriphagus aestuariicola]